MCGVEFIAQKTSTIYCSGVCSKRAYKARKREEKVNANNEAVKATRTPASEKQMSIDEREFLSLTQVAQLIGCSRRNIYYLIEAGQLKATNIMKKKTIITRGDINQLLDAVQPEKPKEYAVSDCYSIGEAQEKFDISGKGLYDLIKRNNIPKFQKGKYVYIPKELIDNIFN